MTSETSYDVVGIGNALVDVLVSRDVSFLDEHDMVKGAMTLIDVDRAESLYAVMGDGLEVSGGSLANSIAGVASFGGRAAYLGRVRDDSLGAVFSHDMQASGVHFATKPAVDGPPTGRSLIVVTGGGDRTMNTFLGASELFGPDLVDRELIAAAQVTFLEGYLFDRPESKEAYWAASEIAHGADRQVALTLSDLFCVERHRDDWLELVRDRVDILFANESEALALWQVADVDSAIERTREQVAVGCITRSEKGSVVVAGDQTYEIPAEPARVVDTTGAGDLYAAGFLYGYTQGRPLPECGRLGSIAAAAVIGHLGARPDISLHQLLDVLDD
jgi:sugar/nucleoside kinase (ribokinase family)